ncbi:uncharacterized protein LOC128409244 [Podarcis raffonei]|uniref:uncharacterized protein LOC128409244 n=1 Tax=Podarcis raffonei TaxID=65483 RepID=UPI00232959FC|nr:uncharacterized protein LOC128409244 [Podarcis raffonei]XP_053235538.1 uncharacterized protein LOC128409244 [Podarcis raffonei]
MAAERAVAANLQMAGDQVLQIKMEEEDEEEEDGPAKGPCVIRAGSLRDILGWPGPEQVKQELGEEVPQCWEAHGQEPLRLIQSPHSGWGPPQQPEELILRQRGARRQEQQVPVLFDEMDVHSPEADHTLLDRRRYLRREAKQRLERDTSSLTGSAVPMPHFPKMSRRGTNWSYAEVIDLLDIWGEQRIQQVLQSSHRNMDTFQVIANEMAKRGHERTAQECRTKTKTMRRDYKKVKENNCSGTGRLTCPFYDQLEQILDSGAPQSAGQAQSYGHQEESGGDDGPLCGLEDGGPHESEDYLEPHDFFDPSAQFSIELVDSVDSTTVVCKTEDDSEEPISTPRPAAEADHLLNPLPPAPPSLPGSPDTTGSTADVHPTPCHSPLPGPTGLSAAERLANIRNRHKKTRNDLAAELAMAADLRMQAATDRILSALDGYAKADLEDREKDRVGTEQIIAIMQRQTELLELLIWQRQSTPAAVSTAPSRQAWPPRTAQSSHRPAGPSSSRLGVPRRPLTPRARARRRPQNYSP